jgi:hypothetical protein
MAVRRRRVDAWLEPVEIRELFGADLGGGTIEEHTSVAQTDQSREECSRQLEIVEAHAQRDSSLATDIGQELDHRARARRIDAGHRFVGQ